MLVDEQLLNIINTNISKPAPVNAITFQRNSYLPFSQFLSILVAISRQYLVKNYLEDFFANALNHKKYRQFWQSR